MRKTMKTKKAFTLIEMVLVVAIVLIIAGVMLMGIGTYVSSAHSAADSVSSYNEDLYSLSRSFMLT